jgi:protein-S-isoprenylcysteine O-methyltransferase Ste14
MKNIMLKIIPPFWMFIYLAIAGAIGAAFPWKNVVNLTNMPLGGVLILAGVMLSFWAFGLFASRGTQIAPMSETNNMLVETGPYRFTRNPMYLGLVIVSSGIAFWSGSLPMFAVPFATFATANWVHIPFEEAKMRRQFGSAFDDYTARVRRWI